MKPVGVCKCGGFLFPKYDRHPDPGIDEKFICESCLQQYCRIGLDVTEIEIYDLERFVEEGGVDSTDGRFGRS